MTEFDIGDKVLVSSYLFRHSEEINYGVELTWKEANFEKPKTMYIIGKKTLSDGFLEKMSEWDEYSGRFYKWNEYKSKRKFCCYVVTERLCGKHYRILCDKVIKLEE